MSMTNAHRLAELEHLRGHYASQDKPHIVSFLDRLIDETRAAMVSGMAELPPLPFVGEFDEAADTGHGD